MARDAPYRIADDTTVENRLRALEGEIARAMRTPEFRRLAMRVEAQVPRVGNDRNGRLAARALATIQALPFRLDPPGTEEFQPGVYTLAHGGDCEDLSVAFVALARMLGLDSQVIWVDQDTDPNDPTALNHVTADVVLGGVPQWADASLRGARVGESPWDALTRLQTTGQHTARADIGGVRERASGA